MLEKLKGYRRAKVDIGRRSPRSKKAKVEECRECLRSESSTPAVVCMGIYEQGDQTQGKSPAIIVDTRLQGLDRARRSYGEGLLISSKGKLGEGPHWPLLMPLSDRRPAPLRGSGGEAFSEKRAPCEGQ
jgi:hypothetical protein